MLGFLEKSSRTDTVAPIGLIRRPERVSIARPSYAPTMAQVAADQADSALRDAAPRLTDLLESRAATEPDHRALIFCGCEDERTITSAQLDRYVRAFAARLLTEVAPGDRVALLYPPGLAYIVSLLACLRAGVIAVPLLPPRVGRTLPRVRAILADAGAAVALTTRRYLDQSGEDRAADAQPAPAGDVRWRVIELADDDPDVSRQLPRARRDVGDPALLQYTSGSTGAPKGVVLTHANLLRNVAMIRDAFGLTRDDVVATWLPPYHDMGLIGGLLTPLFLGCAVVISPPLSFLQRPLGWLKTISRFRATASPAPNFAYQLCVDKLTPERAGDLDLSSLRVAFVGAEPVRAATLDRFAEAFAPYGFRRAAFAPCYGLAEATLLVSGRAEVGPQRAELSRSALDAGRVRPAADVDDRCTIIGSGPPAPGLEVRVLDPVSAASVPAGTIGEICVRGPSVSAGYWGKPEETARTYRRIDGGAPFLFTGDLGYLAGGELFVTGRRKEIIIIRGRNLYPRDIEEIAGGAHPGTHPDRCVAFAIATPNGEGLAILAEFRDLAHAAQQREATAAIRTAVTADLDIAPHDVVLVKAGTLPRTSSGKLQRLRARDAYLDGTFAGAR